MDALLMVAKLFCLGFAVSVPLGPVSLLVLKSALNRKVRHALLTGLGAALADGLLALMAFWGVGEMELFLNTHHQTVHLILGGVMIIVATRLLSRSPPPTQSSAHLTSVSPAPPLTRPAYAVWGFGSGFVMTVLNPLTLATFVSGFSLLGLSHASLGWRDLSTGLWVFLGGLSWWVTLAFIGLWGYTQVSSSFVATLTRALCHVVVISGLCLVGRSLWLMCLA